MRTCGVAVVGLGLMGAAAFHAVARRGADVIGFDPLAVGERRGSSHGSCRIYRRFNFETPAYTALSDQALAAWRALEVESGTQILEPCPVLAAGPSGSALVRGSRAAAQAAGAIGGPSCGAEANALYPALNLPDDWEVTCQDSGGILLAERALCAFRSCAAAPIIPLSARIAPTAGGVRVVTRDAEVLAERVILAAGPWIGGLVPGLRPHLTVTRQAVGWFAPSAPRGVALGACPVFLLDAPQGLLYGFPDFEGLGVKAGLHDHGPAVDADAWGPDPSDEELAPVSAALAALAPGAAGPVVGRDVCLYTNTRPADARPDAGEEFIIDRLPRDPRIIVASACSGHGAKFASAIGEILADLALEPGYQADPAFRLDRFSSFAA
jgi:sarcosine oxidase